MSEWTPAYFCKHCHARLSWSDRYDNGGVCTHCGMKGKFNMPDEYIRVYRKIRLNSRWNFWKPKYRIEWKDEIEA